MTKNRNRRIVILCVSIFAVAATAVLLLIFQRNNLNDLTPSQRNRTEKMANEVFDYAKKNKLNTDYALLLDYSIPSGTPRLFLWDYNKKGVVARFYVMHGCGGGAKADKPVFGNKVGCECSSLGKFQVTKHQGGTIKPSFRLKGLESCNSNAWRRGVMIHRSTWVDQWAGKVKYIPLHRKSCQGCITVSTRGLNYLRPFIREQSTPLLLYSYY